MKTKCMVISKKPRRRNQEIEGKIIEQLITFKYFGVEITSSRNLTEDAKRQSTKASG